MHSELGIEIEHKSADMQSTHEEAMISYS